MIVDEELKPFCQSRFLSMVFGKRRHQLWMLNNERRIFALNFDEVSDQFIN